LLSAILRRLSRSKDRSAETLVRLRDCEKQLSQYKTQLDIELLRVHRLERDLDKTKNEIALLRAGFDYVAYYRSNDDDQDSTLVWIRDWLDGKSREVNEFEDWRSERDRRNSLTEARIHPPPR
jgi:hypothetical protein